MGADLAVTDPPTVGMHAPDFRTRNQYGQQVSLAELRGAPVVLVFYPWAFTRTCTSELQGLRDSSAQFRDQGAQLLAISTDTMFSLRVFAEQERIGFDLLTDHWPHGAIAQAYGVFDAEAGCALRGSFVLDAQGVVTWSVVRAISGARDVAEHLAALTSSG